MFFSHVLVDIAGVGGGITMGAVWFEVVRAKFPMNKQCGLRVTTMFRITPLLIGRYTHQGQTG